MKLTKLINSRPIEWQRCSGGQIIRETDTGRLLGFTARELFACNHHWHGRFGNKVIGEGAKKDTKQKKISAVYPVFLRFEYMEESEKVIIHTL